MQHFIQNVPVDWPGLFETRAELSVYLSDCDFDLWVFSWAFKIAVAVYRAYRGALPTDG